MLRPIAIILVLQLALVLNFPAARNPANAQSIAPCEIALVLAIDASSSVSDGEYRLQMDGTANALLSQEVVDAILSLNGVYLIGFEWNGATNQSLLFDWTELRSLRDIANVAQQITTHVRNNRKAPTALGSALSYAHNLFQHLPSNCLRNVIDVSGDGVSNFGMLPATVFQIYDFSEITVNGLAIVDPKKRNKKYYKPVDEYYIRELLNGPGSFVIVADGFEDFGRAMREKLLKEFTPSPIGLADTVDNSN